MAIDRGDRGAKRDALSVLKARRRTMTSLRPEEDDDRVAGLEVGSEEFQRMFAFVYVSLIGLAFKTIAQHLRAFFPQLKECSNEALYCRCRRLRLHKLAEIEQAATIRGFIPPRPTPRVPERASEPGHNFINLAIKSSNSSSSSELCLALPGRLKVVMEGKELNAAQQFLAMTSISAAKVVEEFLAYRHKAAFGEKFEVQYSAPSDYVMEDALHNRRFGPRVEVKHVRQVLVSLSPPRSCSHF